MSKRGDGEFQIGILRGPVALVFALLVGGFVGVTICYFFLSGQPFFVNPLIDNAVRATVAAQPTCMPPDNEPCSTGEHAQPPITCSDYGIGIALPANGAAVGGTVQVSGTYQELPDEGIVLINKSPDQSMYWPSSSIIKIDKSLKTWSGEVFVYGDPPQNAEIVVAVAGQSGRALFDYYFKVGRITNNWHAIETLTSDVVICARATVQKTTE